MKRQFGVIKGIAIVLVLITHTIVMGMRGYDLYLKPMSQSTGNLLIIIEQLGLVAVPLFLFVAGCYAGYAYKNKSIKTAYSLIFSNLIYILCPYFIWSIAFYVLIYFDGNKVFDLWGYIKNLIVGYPFNFVPILVFFYLITPLLINFKRQYKIVFLCLLLFYQIAITFMMYPQYFGLSFPEQASWIIPPVIGTQLSLWGIYFPIGFFYQDIFAFMERAKNILLFLFGLIWLILMVLTVASLEKIIFLPWIFYFVPLPVVFGSGLITREKIPFHSELEKLGKRSYGYYLLNLILLDLIVLGIGNYFSFLFDYHAIFFLVIFVLVLITLSFVMMILERLLGRKFSRYLFG